MKVMFTGSFNPVTEGHRNVLTRATRLFDEVVAGVLVNPDKTYGASLSERFDAVSVATKDIEGVRVAASDGLAVELAKGEDCAYLIRGLRNAADYSYERQISAYNSGLGMQTLYFLATDGYEKVSSTAVREGKIKK